VTGHKREIFPVLDCALFDPVHHDTLLGTSRDRRGNTCFSEPQAVQHQIGDLLCQRM
jgi:hypothetical protein